MILIKSAADDREHDSKKDFRLTKFLVHNFCFLSKRQCSESLLHSTLLPYCSIPYSRYARALAVLFKLVHHLEAQSRVHFAHPQDQIYA